jgi:hypothetical protein
LATQAIRNTYNEHALRNTSSFGYILPDIALLAGGPTKHLALPGEGSMVLALSIIGVVVGIALGLRLKVLILVPAIALAVMFALTIGIARGDDFWLIVLAMVIVGPAIQLGYFVGIFLAKHIQWPP